MNFLLAQRFLICFIFTAIVNVNLTESFYLAPPVIWKEKGGPLSSHNGILVRLVGKPFSFSFLDDNQSLLCQVKYTGPLEVVLSKAHQCFFKRYTINHETGYANVTLPQECIPKENLFNFNEMVKIHCSTIYLMDEQKADRVRKLPPLPYSLDMSFDVTPSNNTNDVKNAKVVDKTLLYSYLFALFFILTIVLLIAIWVKNTLGHWRYCDNQETKFLVSNI